jgi:hypothetical protein
MGDNEVLGEFTIATPCPMDWDKMPGDDRKRFCAACGKHVHDLTAMSPDERVSLLSKASPEGEGLCGRLHQPLEWASLIPTEGPARPGQVTGAWQFTIRSVMAAIAAFATILGFMKVWLRSLEEPAPPPPSRNLRPLMGVVERRPRALPTTGGPACPSPAPPARGAGG